MVHEEVRPLLALALVSLDKGKRLFIQRLLAHGLTLLLAGAAAVAGYQASHGDSDRRDLFEGVEVVATLLAAASEFVAFYFHHLGVHLHGLGRRAMRHVMLLDAMSPAGAPATEAEFREEFDADVQARAAARLEHDGRLPPGKQLASYYWSPKPCAEARLRDHLYESAIFSQHLYTAAWQVSLVVLFLLLLPALAVPLLVWHSHGMLVLRVVLVLVAFLPACQELDHLLLYRWVARELASVVKRVEALYLSPVGVKAPDPRLMAEFGDYSAATTLAPPIRTVVYWALHGRLSADFEQRMQQLGQAPAPPV
jgi:hypothetical protein